MSSELSRVASEEDVRARPAGAGTSKAPMNGAAPDYVGTRPSGAPTGLIVSMPSDLKARSE